MLIHLDLVFEALVQNMLLSSHSDTFAGIRDFFCKHVPQNYASGMRNYKFS